MTSITVIGGTGYTGSHIIREAAARGHQVTSLSRSLPAEQLPGVTYLAGSATDPDALRRAVTGADVVFAAISPRAGLGEDLLPLYADLADLAAASGARLGVVGGFSALRPAAGAPRFAEGDDVPPEFAEEARVMAAVVDYLIDEAPESLDWFYASPAASYGAYAPGTPTGTYRTGGDVALFDDNGESAISGPDFALALVDEADKPRHHRTHFGVTS